MSALGVHAGLALAGIVAGLPVAAVVQWRREPPAEIWSPFGCDFPRDASDLGPVEWGEFHRFGLPHGRGRVTSVLPGTLGKGVGGCSLSSIVPGPGVFYGSGHSLRMGEAREYAVTDDPPLSVTQAGMTWRRIRVMAPR